MPGFDTTGPAGQGSQTGRKQGRCNAGLAGGRNINSGLNKTGRRMGIISEDEGSGNFQGRGEGRGAKKAVDKGAGRGTGRGCGKGRRANFKK